MSDIKWIRLGDIEVTAEPITKEQFRPWAEANLQTSEWSEGPESEYVTNGSLSEYTAFAKHLGGRHLRENEYDRVVRDGRVNMVAERFCYWMQDPKEPMEGTARSSTASLTMALLVCREIKR
jgi:hypothetical protein